MRYDLTMKELLEIVQKELDKLKGKNVMKEGGIAKLVEEAISKIEIEGSSLTRYNIYVDHCWLKMYCAGVDEEIEFAVVRQTYRLDKRTSNGYGNILKNVTLELTKEIPLDMSVLDVSQFLDYKKAKTNFERLERQQKELLEEYKNNQEVMKKLQEVMKNEAYNTETKKEAERAEEILNSFR